MYNIFIGPSAPTDCPLGIRPPPGEGPEKLYLIESAAWILLEALIHHNPNNEDLQRTLKSIYDKYDEDLV